MTQPDLARLEGLLKRTVMAENGCLEWTGPRSPSGYGLAYHNGKHTTAHRIIFGLATGTAPPSGMHVCHRCDNPPCVNPDHLFLGTPAENAQDMIAKGRGPDCRKTPARRALISASVLRALAEGRLVVRRGEASTSAKLTADQARAIFASAETPLSLAARYGVSPRAIGMIKRKETWASVHG